MNELSICVPSSCRSKSTANHTQLHRTAPHRAFYICTHSPRLHLLQAGCTFKMNINMHNYSCYLFVPSLFISIVCQPMSRLFVQRSVFVGFLYINFFLCFVSHHTTHQKSQSRVIIQRKHNYILIIGNKIELRAYAEPFIWTNEQNKEHTPRIKATNTTRFSRDEKLQQ